jgi:uncharacterized membrane protein YdfJ with MMPL/SSD domain
VAGLIEVPGQDARRRVVGRVGVAGSASGAFAAGFARGFGAGFALAAAAGFVVGRLGLVDGVAAPVEPVALAALRTAGDFA